MLQNTYRIWSRIS